MKKEPQAPQGAPGWMVTYGDLVSLLMCFFVLLYSMSSADTQKMAAAVGSLNDAFGFSENPNSSDPAYVQLRLDELNNRIAERIAQKKGRGRGTEKHKADSPKSAEETGKGAETPRGDETKTQLLPRVDLGQDKGVLVQFTYGVAELDGDAKTQLKEFHARLVGSPYKIVLKGYSSVGEDGQYRQGINLAFARSVNVRNYLVSLGMKNNQFQILVVGEFETVDRDMLAYAADRDEANSAVVITNSTQTIR